MMIKIIAICYNFFYFTYNINMNENIKNNKNDYELSINHKSINNFDNYSKVSNK